MIALSNWRWRRFWERATLQASTFEATPGFYQMRCFIRRGDRHEFHDGAKHSPWAHLDARNKSAAEDADKHSHWGRKISRCGSASPQVAFDDRVQIIVEGLGSQLRWIVTAVLRP